MTDSMWISWGASVIGPLHTRKGIPNQDAWMARQYKWGSVVVVSDGLGSKPHSDHGSKAACLAVFEAAKTYSNNRQAKVADMLRLIHANWLVGVAPFSPSDCSATCLFVIQKDEQLTLGRLGDGLIIAHGETDADCRILCDEKEDSFSNFTYCLTDEFNPDQWETVTVDIQKCRAVVLCTDGVADDLLPDKRRSFAKELYLNYKNLEHTERKRDLRRWLNEWPVPGHSDDKTVACLFKRGESK